MVTRKHIVGLIVAVLLTTTSVFLVLRREKTATYISSSLLSLRMATKPTPDPIPQPTNHTSVMDSPEGDKTLTLERETFQERVSHAISVSTKLDGQRVQIIKEAPVFGPPGVSGNRRSPVSAVSATGEAALDTQPRIEDQIRRFQDLELPFNTWSPDTVYFFLKENGQTSDDYLVFQSSGTPFVNGEMFLSVQKLFAENIEGYIIEDVTGWASPTLLVVNTKAIEGDTKVSFWFDVPSQSFIQLGTYFK